MNDPGGNTVRFLVIRMSSIGDIVLTTPVIRGLKQQVEHAQVHFLVKEAFYPVVRANPYIDRIHIFRGNLGDTIRELRKEQFDYIIDLHHNIRSSLIKKCLRLMHFSFRKLNFRKWLLVRFKINTLPQLHIVDRYLETVRLFDVKNDGEGLDYFIPPEDELDRSAFPEPFRKGYVLMVAGAAHATKKLTAEQMAEIICRMNLPVVLAGGPAEEEEAKLIQSLCPGIDVWNTCGEFNINRSASLVRQSSVVITPDTGLMHVAAAFRKPVISVWGNTVPEFGMTPYMPHPASTIFEVKGLSCRPCSKIGYDRCPKKHFHCILKQPLNDITDQAVRLFQKYRYQL
ncbi:MAG TPA: glycosyltransferase family 9 protein [Bacteroidetes bacterium]|nr:glycosyltransferase family 9 protein [Bacteroidota bacterium]